MPQRHSLQAGQHGSPHANTFSLGILKHRRLSGSVQWQCIRNGSGDVQLLNPASRPNHCGYTAKHYVELHINEQRHFESDPMRASLILVLLALAAVASAQPYSMDWSKIAGGGGTSRGGLYSVSI